MSLGVKICCDLRSIRCNHHYFRETHLFIMLRPVKKFIWLVAHDVLICLGWTVAFWHVYVMCKDKAQVAVTTIFSNNIHFCVERFCMLWVVSKYTINCSSLVILPHFEKPKIKLLLSNCTLVRLSNASLHFFFPNTLFPKSNGHYSIPFYAVQTWVRGDFISCKKQLNNIPRVVYQWTVLICHAWNRTVCNV